MERALSVSGLFVAAVIGALIVAASRFPMPESLSDWLTPFVGAAAIGQALFAFWALQGLAHSREQAEAASAGLEVARDTAQKQLRAYVNVVRGTIGGFGPGEVPVARVFVRNTGQTPAIEVKCSSRFFLIDAPGPDDFPALGEDQSLTPLAPGGDFHLTIDAGRPISVYESHGLFTKAAVIMISGEITYCDIYGEAHVTRFHLRNEFSMGEPALRPHGVANTMT